MATDVAVRHAPDRDRYEITVDGELAGFTEYDHEDGTRAFVHTEISRSHQGQGLAGKLIGAALDATRQAGLPVRPYCSFVRSYIASHDDVHDLVRPTDRNRFGLPDSPG